MNYFEVITATKSWTCPKSGIYKIIAVGGGSSHAVQLYDSSTPLEGIACASGGNTTFGNILTAKGGAVSSVGAVFKNGGTSLYRSFRGGAGGYDLQKYGGEGGICIGNTNPISMIMPPTINGGVPGKQGSGYGAGGASSLFMFDISFKMTANSSSKSIEAYILESVAGELAEIAIDIQEGTSYNCVIGDGGVMSADKITTLCSNNDVILSGTSDTRTRTINALSSPRQPGRSGCIVIEYLGESL